MSEDRLIERASERPILIDSEQDEEDKPQSM